MFFLSLRLTMYVHTTYKRFVGYIWHASDPNAKGNKDMCRGFKISNVCADKQKLCSTAAECKACRADGSMAVVSAKNPKTVRKHTRATDVC